MPVQQPGPARKRSDVPRGSDFAGVLSRINQVFGENNINIAAQYLQTNAQIGYVVIDVEAEHSQAALEKLRGVDGTIRTRVLF